MFNSWRKVKKSGAYYRRVKQEREEILRNARIIAERLNARDCRSQFLRPAQLVPTPPAPLILNINVAQPSTSHANERIREKIDDAIEDLDGKGLTPEEDFDTDDEELADEESDNIAERNRKMRFAMRKWAVEHRITQLALRDIMESMNAILGKVFPSDPRTLMETPSENSITNFNDGSQYWHNGFKKAIEYIFRKIEEPETISVNINMDGLPLFNSSKTEFWPILFNITEMPELAPVAIGIFCGTAKCIDLASFLGPFVEEMKDAMAHGIIVNSQKITVQLRAIICDSPARAYVKGTTYILENICLYLYKKNFLLNFSEKEWRTSTGNTVAIGAQQSGIIVT